MKSQEATVVGSYRLETTLLTFFCHFSSRFLLSFFTTHPDVSPDAKRGRNTEAVRLPIPPVTVLYMHTSGACPPIARTCTTPCRCEQVCQSGRGFPLKASHVENFSNSPINQSTFCRFYTRSLTFEAQKPNFKHQERCIKQSFCSIEQCIRN